MEASLYRVGAKRSLTEAENDRCTHFFSPSVKVIPKREKQFFPVPASSLFSLRAVLPVLPSPASLFRPSRFPASSRSPTSLLSSAAEEADTTAVYVHTLARSLGATTGLSSFRFFPGTFGPSRNLMSGSNAKIDGPSGEVYGHPPTAWR